MNCIEVSIGDFRFIPESCQLAGKIKPYRNVYLIEGEDGSYILKPLKIGAMKANLVGELLSNQEFKSFLPQLLKPGPGKYYFWHGGNRYFVTRKIDGHEADYDELPDLQAAIKTMGRFHQLTEELVAGNPDHWAALRFKPLTEWPKRIREMEICRDMAIRIKDTWSKQYLKVWRLFFEEAVDTVAELGSCRFPQAEALCYHDWAYHNIMIHQGTAFLIDFDYMLADQPVHDRANLIGRYLRFHQWTVDALLKILWNFDRLYHWKAHELKLLRLFLAFPYEYWMLGRQYFIEKQPWSFKYYQDQWERKISNYKRRQSLLDLLKTLERE